MRIEIVVAGSLADISVEIKSVLTVIISGKNADITINGLRKNVHQIHSK